MLLPIMIGATLQHAGNGWLFTAPNGGWEFPAFWTVMLVVQALLGDGAFAWRPAFLPARTSGRLVGAR
jgi:putative oxidoreductase